MTNMTVMAVYGKTLKNLFSKNMALKQHFIKSILDSYTISFVQMIWSEINLDIFTQLEIVEILVPEFLVFTDASERLQIFKKKCWSISCLVSILLKIYRFQNYALPLSTTIPFHRWMDDLQFNILFISISVMSGPWVDDNERLCVMESYWSFRRFRFQQGSNPGR